MSFTVAQCTAEFGGFLSLDMFRDENALTKRPATLVLDPGNVYFRCLALWQPHQIASHRWFFPPPPPPNLDSFEGFTTLDAKIKAPLKVLNQQLFHSTYFGIAPDHRTVVPGHSPIPRVNDLDEARTFF